MEKAIERDLLAEAGYQDAAPGHLFRPFQKVIAPNRAGIHTERLLVKCSRPAASSDNVAAGPKLYKKKWRPYDLHFSTFRCGNSSNYKPEDVTAFWVLRYVV